MFVPYTQSTQKRGDSLYHRSTDRPMEISVILKIDVYSMYRQRADVRRSLSQCFCVAILFIHDDIWCLAASRYSLLSVQTHFARTDKCMPTSPAYSRRLGSLYQSVIGRSLGTPPILSPLACTLLEVTMGMPGTRRKCRASSSVEGCSAGVSFS